MYLSVCCYHVTYPIQSESILYTYLIVKERLARNRLDIWSLSDYNETRFHNHLVCKRTLSHLAKLTKWLRWVVSTYLYGAFDCILLSCHLYISEWIHSLHLGECQGSPSSKQAWYLKKKWLQRDSNPQLLNSETQLNHLAKLTKWLSWVLSTDLYGAFDSILSSCHVRIWDWMHTVHLPECQGTPCSKQSRYLKFKRRQRSSNLQPLSL